MYQIYPDDVLGSGQFGIVYGGKLESTFIKLLKNVFSGIKNVDGIVHILGTLGEWGVLLQEFTLGEWGVLQQEFTVV